MDQVHLSVETIAKWLSGRLEHDEVRAQVVPHLLSACPVCFAAYEEVLQRQGEMRHWDELIAVQESQAAHELYASLKDLPFADQLRRVEDDESLHQWGFCQLLLAKNKESLFENPGRSLELAELAARIARHLGDAYDREWVRDLRALALAYVANALRVLGELCGSEAVFRVAEDHLVQSASGNVQIQAEILDLRCSLLGDQRRWQEALELCRQVAVLYEEMGDRRGAAKAKLRRASIFFEVDEVEQALALFRGLLPALDATFDLDLLGCAQFNILCCLIQSGSIDAAEDCLPEVRALLFNSSDPLKAVHLQWAEGRIHFVRGRTEAAEESYRAAQTAFLDRQMAYDAALVSLDLAILLAREGRSSELKRLALDSMVFFESQEIHREAMATLLMFQEACRDELLTAEMASQIARFLRRERRSEVLGGGRGYRRENLRP